MHRQNRLFVLLHVRKALLLCVLVDEEMFWSASIEEMMQGYVYNHTSEEYVCLICRARFEEGVIYPKDDLLLEAKKAIKHHISDIHTSMFDYLLNMDKKYTGITEHQKDLMVHFKNGLTDKEIVEASNGGSTSTIRNHRFRLNEKEKQAKVFLTMMALMKSDKDDSQHELVTFHKGAKMVDERYAITTEEKEKVLVTYFKEGVDGPLDLLPSKEKRKIIVLQQIVKRFVPNTIYSEKEINEVLKSIHSDFATIRRYLIEYGFMDRSTDCAEYWVKN